MLAANPFGPSFGDLQIPDHTHIAHMEGASPMANPGKAILESWGFRLAEIDDPEKFEKFDFCLERNKDVYIDFKNWSERDREDRVTRKMLSYEKLEKIGGKKAFIINMIAEEFDMHDSDGIVEVSTLYKCKKGAVYGPSFSIKSDLCKKLKEAERYGD